MSKISYFASTRAHEVEHKISSEVLILLKIMMDMKTIKEINHE